MAWNIKNQKDLKAAWPAMNERTRQSLLDAGFEHPDHDTKTGLAAKKTGPWRPHAANSQKMLAHRLIAIQQAISEKDYETADRLANTTHEILEGGEV